MSKAHLRYAYSATIRLLQQRSSIARQLQTSYSGGYLLYNKLVIVEVIYFIVNQLQQRSSTLQQTSQWNRQLWQQHIVVTHPQGVYNQRRPYNNGRGVKGGDGKDKREATAENPVHLLYYIIHYVVLLPLLTYINSSTSTKSKKKQL